MSVKLVEYPGEEERREKAWKESEEWLRERSYLIHTAFMSTRHYEQFGFCLGMLGISGWPVVALWDDLKETMRDMQG